MTKRFVKTAETGYGEGVGNLTVTPYDAQSRTS